MRFTPFLSIWLAVAGASVHGDDKKLDENSKTQSGSSSSSSTDIIRPSFTPSPITGPFVEQFQSGWESRWKPSSAKKEQPGSTEEWAYVGKWNVEEPNVYPGLKGDKGLVVKNKAALHAISAKFDTPIDNTGKTLVVQYEVKPQDGLECGGAYLKLLQNNQKLHAEEFSNTTPYVIMFGPDRCGSTNKVHFIFRHKNLKTGVYEEKHLTNTSTVRLAKTSALYTLIVRPDQTYEIRINGEKVGSGSLFEDFDPPVNPEKEIDDLNDKKPDSWVDTAKIPDANAVKPDDWDEDAPLEIPDEDATQPEDWLVHEPLDIPDPEANKPDNWDDEEDGDWIAPTIANPKCEKVSGCGRWERPMKPNPDYKGKWSAPLIDNPEYKGVWKPQKIANPEFFEHKTPADFEPIGAIGFEIWTMQANILFDNIYIGHSIKNAEAFQKETFDLKLAIEKKQEEQSSTSNSEDQVRAPSKKFSDDPVTYLKQYGLFYVKQFQSKFDLFVTIAKTNPIEAAKIVPEIVGVLAVGFLLVIFILISLKPKSSSPSSVSPKSKKGSVSSKSDASSQDKDKGSSTATENAEAVKRNTPSTIGVHPETSS